MDVPSTSPHVRRSTVFRVSEHGQIPVVLLLAGLAASVVACSAGDTSPGAPDSAPDDVTECDEWEGSDGWGEDCLREDGGSDDVENEAEVDGHSATECEDWACDGRRYPLQCLRNPVAKLSVSDDNFDDLLEDVEADIEVDAGFCLHGVCLDVGLDLQGGISVRYPKKSFKIKFNREERYPLDPFVHAEGESASPDPVGFKHLILKAHWIDGTLSRDRLASDLLAEIGGLGPRVTYVNLLLNGQYRGLYALTESIDTDYFERMGLEGDGNLYKAVNHNANFGKKTDFMAGYEKKANQDEPSTDLKDLLDAIAAAPLDADEFQAKVGPLLDLDMYRMFTAVNVFSDNRDTFTKNYYLYHEEGVPDLGFLIVNWDADATFGLNWDGDELPADEGSLWGKKNSLSTKLAKIPELDDEYTSYMEALLSSTFSADHSRSLLDQMATEAAPDVRFEECRWPDKPHSFEAELARVRKFLPARVDYLKGLLK